MHQTITCCHMPNRAKRALGKACLRGPVLSTWTLRQFTRLDRAYVAELARSASQGLPQPVRPRHHASERVRKILVIADCMWEQNELVPDLQRQWSVSLLDLNPSLRGCGN